MVDVQTYVLKRGSYGLKERITYIDYVRDDSIAAKAGIQEGERCKGFYAAVCFFFSRSFLLFVS